MSLSFNNVNLDEVVDFVRGLTYSKKDEVEFSKNVVLRANNINVESSELNFTELKYIKNEINIPLTKIVKKNTLLICTASGSKKHLGKIALIDKDYGYAFGGFMGLLVPKENIVPKFLFYRLISETFKNYIDNLSDGVNINNLRFDLIRNFKVPLPPISEQKRIVAILDKAFAAIDKAKANAEKNLANARELFESYLNKIFAPSTSSGRRNPGEDWEEKKLDSVCVVERGSSPRPIKKYLTTDANGVNWIKIGDTKGIDKYLFETKEKITLEGSKKSRYVKEGDFILSNSMSFGKPFIMKTSGYIHDGWFVLRLNDYIDTEFFYYLLISPTVQNQFKTLSSGAIVKNISSNLVKKAILPIPSKNEQRKIAKEIEDLSKETKKLEAIYQRKLADLEELKKSILQKAFSGQLSETRIKGIKR